MKRSTYPVATKISSHNILFTEFKLTELVVTKGLNNLRHEEEGQMHRMLFQNTMCILQDQGIVIISLLKECDCKDGWNRSPQQKVLDMGVSQKEVK